MARTSSLLLVQEGNPPHLRLERRSKTRLSFRPFDSAFRPALPAFFVLLAVSPRSRHNKTPSFLNASDCTLNGHVATRGELRCIGVLEEFGRGSKFAGFARA